MDISIHKLIIVRKIREPAPGGHIVPKKEISQRNITVYQMVPFKERIQCAERFGFAGPRESVNTICIL
jgi:hypothetical protein